MALYKIHIHDRNYTSWKIYNVENFPQETEVDFIDPLKEKLLSNDNFTVDFEKSAVSIQHSPVRTTEFIAGILVLKSNKTYGRDAKTNKLLYKVVPDDRRIPAFIVPYENKKIGFSKVYVNLYVTFVFDSWEEKHPRGKLSQVLGSVDELDHFYEYQLYCKNLNQSIQKFSKDTSKALNQFIKNNSHENCIDDILKRYPSIQDRRDQSVWHIITIDPDNSIDFDDGFSLRPGPGPTASSAMISIYISNVIIWMEMLNLWESFSRRISTIYLPDRKKPMLPTILSDNLCSLQKNVSRFAFVMDVVFDKSSGEVFDISYKNCVIKVAENYCYEEPKLVENEQYLNLLEACQTLSKQTKYMQTVRNSHILVSYLMVFMNHHCAQHLINYKNGIFRAISVQTDQDQEQGSIPESIPEEIVHFIKIWKSNIGGQYVNAETIKNVKEDLVRHDLLKMDVYIHITSPIRRLVDLLNVLKFQENENMIPLSVSAKNFYSKWTTVGELEYINSTMRSIRKVQNDCALLEMYTNHPHRLEEIYEGYLFDRVDWKNGIYQYFVHLPKIKMTLRVQLSGVIPNYEKRLFKLYLFLDEESLKKKIKIQMIE
jgi:exoribonuclease R